MDDLAGKISELLSSPEGMEKIKNLASLLGQSSPPDPPAQNVQNTQNQQNAQSTQNDTNPLGALGSLGSLGALGSLLGGNSGGNSSGGSALDGDTLKAVMKIVPLLSSFRQEDDSTRLLRALRPMLGGERQRKLDEALQMLQMMRLLPLLKNQGIL